MTEPAPAVAPLQRLLDGLDVAVFACDASGVVGAANAAARSMLPGLATGEPAARVRVPELSAALAAGLDAFECEERALVGTRTTEPDGWTVWQVRDVAAERTREDALVAERTRSAFLIWASRRLGGSLNPARTERAIVDLAVELGDAATLVLPHGRGGYRWRHVARGSVESQSHGQCVRSAVPPGVLEAMDGFTAGPDDQPADQITGDWLADADIAGQAEATVIPLPGDRLPAPTLVVWRKAATSSFDDPQRTTLTEFAARADAALAASRLYAQQAHVATVLRSSLVPRKLPAVPGVALGAQYRPAHEAALIGGDFYSVHPDSEHPIGGTLFAFGDVMGKGVEAAATTGTVRQTLDALHRAGSDHEAMLRILNTLLLDGKAADERFVTLVLGTVWPTGRGVRLRMSGGGHLPPLVVRGDGEVEPVEIGGTVVGALADATFATATVDLAPGELCVLYTDGVTEAPGGALGNELYGEDRLRATLRGSQVMPAAAIAERLALQADLWSAHTKHDDLTVLVIQAVP